MAPGAISISASQQWDGNDGPWSTFAITVGSDPAPTLFVLPSTSGRSTWVVISLGCQELDPQTCASRRGGLFDFFNSTTFKRDGNEYYQMNFAPEDALNQFLPNASQYSGIAALGTDRLGFGYTSFNANPVLENQLIANYATNVPFLGQIGLSAFNESIRDYSDTYFSVLGALNHSAAIPSAYWGYTAGAQYRNAYGSLTFGGYDANRGNVHDVLTVPMAQDSDRTLSLQLLTTTLRNGSDQPWEIDVASTVFIDSVVPEIWLSRDACTMFEKTFNIVWNDTVKMYLVDEQVHDQLTKDKASVTFSLAAATGDIPVNITLPYAAFNLTAGYPLLEALYPNDTTTTLRYFPLKRTNGTQFYLGRTFLQEAYVAADFDRGEFYVSQATFDSPKTDIRSVIYPPPKSLSGGTIAGIVLGVVAALAILGGLLWWFCCRKRTGKKSKRRDTVGTSSVGDDTTIAEWNNSVQMTQVEQYKPAEMSGDEVDQYKPELDATVTARGPPTERHELWGGHVRRVSDQSRASISPLDERHRNNRFSHNRTLSGNSFGQPSPPMSDHPSPPLGTPGRESPFGQPSPRSGSRTPAASEQDRNWFGGVPVYHELHGRSRDSPRSPTSPVRTPEEVPLSSENVFSQSEQEGRRSGFVEQFDAQARPDSRA